MDKPPRRIYRRGRMQVHSQRAKNLGDISLEFERLLIREIAMLQLQ